VIVHGVDDSETDGNVAYTLVTAPAVSTDQDYDALDPAEEAPLATGRFALDQNGGRPFERGVVEQASGAGPVRAEGPCPGRPCQQDEDETGPGDNRFHAAFSPSGGDHLRGWCLAGGESGGKRITSGQGRRGSRLSAQSSHSVRTEEPVLRQAATLPALRLTPRGRFLQGAMPPACGATVAPSP